jgi:hypothetical protein
MILLVMRIVVLPFIVGNIRQSVNAGVIIVVVIIVWALLLLSSSSQLVPVLTFPGPAVVVVVVVVPSGSFPPHGTGTLG